MIFAQRLVAKLVVKEGIDDSDHDDGFLYRDTSQWRGSGCGMHRIDHQHASNHCLLYTAWNDL